MGALIQSWRKAWGHDFPFLYMQKPSGGGTTLDLVNPTSNKAKPFLRTAGRIACRQRRHRQRDAHQDQQHPHTAMVISTALGGMPHPENKSGNFELSSGLCRSGVYSNDDLVLRR